MNATHERLLLLRDRLRKEKATEAAAVQLEVPWKTNGLLARCVFFLLTAAGAGAFYGLCAALEVPRNGILCGAIFLVIAEILIGTRKWFFTGVEEALWLGGIFSLITELPSSGQPESWLVVAAAWAVAGWRVRNPLFGAVAAIVVMVYCEERFDLGVISAILLSAGAMLLLLRTWRRPSTEWLLFAIAVALLIAGRFTADAEWRNVTILLYTILGILALFLAIRRRHHAFYLTGIVSLTIAAADFSERIAAPVEAKLAVAGAFLLVVALIASRKEKSTGGGEALEMLATVAYTPEVSPPAAEPGGKFGGAGASGDY